jgi:hypothetical protein
VEIAELDELLDEPLDELELFELLDELTAAVAVVDVDVVVDVDECPWWCAWTSAAT